MNQSTGAESSRTVDVFVGTRPEAVKTAPLVAQLRRCGQPVRIVDTSQQPGRVNQALAPFGLAADEALPLRRSTGQLAELVSQLMRTADDYLGRRRPAAVVVQGDTTTAFTAAFAAAMRELPVIHLEAGLRTDDRRLPFPEEINRTLIADIATLHLAPTPAARAALAREGHRGDHVVVTGNTVVDALHTVLPLARRRPLPAGAQALTGHERLLVVTVHRREAWGAGVRAVARSVASLLTAHPALAAVVVTHPNPAVAADVRAVLAGVARCAVIDPLPYDDMLALLARADLALTDSGGIQEEAPSIGIPCVVTRSVTERAEGVAAGWADLVGLSEPAIVAAVAARLAPQARLPDTGNPYGDGRAARRCAQAIRWHLGLADRPADWVPSVSRVPPRPGPRSDRPTPVVEVAGEQPSVDPLPVGFVRQ